jgi:hypothetical protein
VLEEEIKPENRSVPTVAAFSIDADRLLGKIRQRWWRARR